MTSASTPVTAAARFGSERLNGPLQLGETGGRLMDAVRDEAVVDDDADERREQPRIGAGSDGNVLEGLGGLGRGRVDDDDPSTTRHDGSQLIGDAGQCEERSV